MFYRFDKKTDTVTEFLPSADQELCGLTLGYVSVAELDGVAAALALPPHTVQQCRQELRHFRGGMEEGERYLFATIRRTGGGADGEDAIALYVSNQLFLVIDIRDSDGSTHRAFHGLLHRFTPTTVTKERLIAAFLDTLIDGDSKLLEELEFTFSGLEDAVLRDVADDDFTIRLLHHKQYLLLLHNYYEQLIDIGETLFENESDLFSKSELRHFHRFIGRVERLCRTVATLREQLSQLRDAYQSTLDLRLGHIMKTFTVLSAICLPLSLIVGWYGMNFDMPEFRWRFGYPIVAILCAAVVLICIKIFKKHHWM